MNITAKEIADLLQGEVIGNEKITISSFAKIEEGKPGAISFLANPKYESYLYNTKSSIVLINEDFSPSKKVSVTLVKVKDAYKAIASLLELYEKSKQQLIGIEQPSFIGENVNKGENIYIGAFSYIGDNSVIGKKH